MFDRKKYKQFAKVQLKGRWTVPVLMSLITFIITSLFSIPKYISIPYRQLFDTIGQGAYKDAFLLYFQSGSEMSIGTSYLLILIELIVTAVLSFAAARIYIKLSQNPEKISFADYLQNFNLWGRGILVELWRSLWLFIWCLTIIPIVFIFSFVIAIASTPKVLAGADINDVLIMPTLILGYVTAFLCLIIMTIKGLSYCMMTLIAAEHENCSITQALNISKIITKGHKWELFVMFLSFIGWHILSFITFNIASFWVKPYISMTKVNAYHALLKEAFEENLIHVEDFE